MSQTRSSQRFIRSQIRNQPAMGFGTIDPTLHRMQWNESPFDFPADLKEEVLQHLARSEWSRYPLGTRGSKVVEAVAKATGINTNQIIAGNGSTDLLRIVHSAVIEPGDHTLTLAPTYRAYTMYAKQLGATPHVIDLDPAQNFALPVDAILEQVAQHNVKLIDLCAPNNPTGTVFPEEQLRKIVTQTDALVLIDAAYAEFCHQDLRHLVNESDNVIIIHTLSKAFALAGVRVGYAISTPEITSELQKLVTAFVFSPFSESAAIVALENLPRFQPTIQSIINERERLSAELAKLPGVTVYPSGTNFILIHLGDRSGKEASRHLLNQQRILLADMNMYAGYEAYLRISIGTPEENNLVVSGLADYLATSS